MRRKLIAAAVVSFLAFAGLFMFFIVMVSAVLGQTIINLSNANGLSPVATACAIQSVGGSVTAPKSPQQVMAAGGPAVPPTALGQPIRSALLAGKTVWVGASDYTGTGGGASGELTPTSMAFAELSTNPSAPLSQLNFSALGNLPFNTTLAISYGPKSVVAVKEDVGAGGPGVTLGGSAAGSSSSGISAPIYGLGGLGLSPGVYPRGVDLWSYTANQLGFSGLGVIAIKLVAMGQGVAPGAVAGAGTGAICTPSPVSGALANKIITIAQSQVGYHDTGNFCTKYGPCEEWCALFATWVWGKAGVPIPSYPFTGSIYTWGLNLGLVLPSTAFPSPGDVVLYGTGPTNPSTSVHTGIVVATNPKTGLVETVEGDDNHQVMFLGWHKPVATSPDGSIYAYVEP